jgi:hypothetical protein
MRVLALRGVHYEGVAEPEQEPPALRVREPLPVDLGHQTARVAQDEAGGRLSDHLVAESFDVEE